MSQQPEEYAVHRLQAAKNAWYYLVSFGRNGKLISKRFYDGRHGGQEAAYQAAIAWRDQMLKATPVLSVKGFCERKRANNASGIPGVTFEVPKRQPEGIWQAKLRVQGHPTQTRSFSVREYGYERAKELAIAARAQMLAELSNRPYLHNELAIRMAREQARTVALEDVATAALGQSQGANHRQESAR